MRKLFSNILGSGSKDLIILHGFLGMGSNWKAQAKRFESIGYRVHLIDLRNHGKSFWDSKFDYNLMVDDLYEYFQYYKLKKTIIIGHSMGGKTAMLLSLLKPELIDQLIISDISPKDYQSKAEVRKIAEGLMNLNLDRIEKRKDLDIHIEKYVNDFVIRQFLMKNLYRLNSGKFSFYPNIKVLEKSISIIEKFPYTGGKFNKPVLFLKGERSNYINIKTDKDLIRSYFPNSKILEIEKAGHWIHFDRPDLFFNKVKDWINIS